MSARSTYRFIDATPSNITDELIRMYEEITGHTVQPSDPERLFIAWVTDFIVRERTNLNYIGNQNIPSRASGENLDALGEFIFGVPRRQATPAKCTLRFSMVNVQNSARAIPEGTRVTDESNTLYWRTTIEGIVAPNALYADVPAECEMDGDVGNGYVSGQINTLVDSVLPFVRSVANVTTSAGGGDVQTDDEYYATLRASLAAFSTAGPKAAYEYFAKSVSDDIADVKVIRPVLQLEGTLDPYKRSGYNYYFVGGEQMDIRTLKVYAHNSSTPLVEDTDYTVSYTDGLLVIAMVDQSGPDTPVQVTQIDYSITQQRAGYVYIYALMNDGTGAGSVIKAAILQACSAENVRPMTDYVSVQDPVPESFNVNVRFFVSEDAQTSMTDIESAVAEAVQNYIKWQTAKLGRDINPDYLKGLLMQTGIKRAIINQPSFTHLSDGADGTAPQIATFGESVITNGGYEDE